VIMSHDTWVSEHVITQVVASAFVFLFPSVCLLQSY
jgi:hypothetical protein